jgi:hypothetical protein
MGPFLCPFIVQVVVATAFFCQTPILCCCEVFPEAGATSALAPAIARLKERRETMMIIIAFAEK